MIGNRVLTRQYRKLLRKFLSAHLIYKADNSKSEPVVFSDEKQIVRIQVLQLLNVLGNVVKTGKAGSFVYDPKRYPLTDMASTIVHLLK